MENGLITVNEIINNNLMPWLMNEDYSGIFDELLSRIDSDETNGNRQFFVGLTDAFQVMNIAISPAIINEWKMFSKFQDDEKTILLTRPIVSYKNRSPKIRFYTLLSGNVAKAQLLYFRNAVTRDENHDFSKYFLTKTLKRLKSILRVKTNELELNDEDKLIVNILKLCVMLVFMEIHSGYDAYVEAADVNMPKNEIFEILVGISMSDCHLSKIVGSLIHRHNVYFKASGDIVSLEKFMKAYDFPNVYKTQAAVSTKMSSKPVANDASGSSIKSGTPVPQIPNEINGNFSEGESKIRDCDNDEIIGSGEAMKILGISESTLRRRIKEGSIPFNQLKVKKHYKFNKAELLNLKKTH